MLSVIIPSKNNEKQKEHSLKSLRESTNVEYTVIEPEIAETSIIAMNNAIKQAEGDVLLIHDDMNFFKYYNKDWLAKVQKAAQNPDVGMITIEGGYKTSGPEYREGMIWFGTWCTYIPKKTIEKIGYLDTNMKIGEDIDYSYRVQKAGMKMLIAPFHHEHHQYRETPHAPQNEKIKREAEAYFKKKHGIK